MTVFDRLKRAMETAQAEQDLPDFLALDIAAILQRPKDYEGREGALNDLVEKVILYDTYGQTGYMGMGVNNVILERTLERLLRPENEQTAEVQPDMTMQEMIAVFRDGMK